MQKTLSFTIRALGILSLGILQPCILQASEALSAPKLDPRSHFTVYDHQMLRRLARYVPVPESFTMWLNEQPLAHDDLDHDHAVYNTYTNGQHHPLFRRFPNMINTLSCVEMGDLPTPVLQCKNLSALFPNVTLYLKNDGLTGKKVDGVRSFGGNKLRKLKYLLGDALAHGHTSVITFGCVGSNHVAQTAVCAQELGLQAISMMVWQPNSYTVRRNLLLQLQSKADIYNLSDRTLRALIATAVCCDYKQRYGSVPYVIPVGGSSAIGAIGYVEAAFELKDQIDAGLVPVPDRIYVTLGSGGTTTGLLLGLKAAGIKTKLYCILDEPESTPGSMAQKVRQLFEETNDLLLTCDPSFGRYTLEASDFEVFSGFSGEDYGLFTKAGVDAMRCVFEKEGIKLDGTYTGKCCSALFSHLNEDACSGKTVLFWNTFCGESVHDICASVHDGESYKKLPTSLHSYFETDVQPLDFIM